MSFYHIKGLLYYFITLFSNIPFIRCFIIQSYTLKWYLLHIKIIYYPLPPLSSTTTTITHTVDQLPQPTITSHPHRSTTDHQYQPLLQKKKKNLKQTLQPISTPTPKKKKEKKKTLQPISAVALVRPLHTP